MLIFGQPVQFDVVPLGDTPQDGFVVEAGPFKRFVGPTDVAFDPFQLTCFDLAVRLVLDA